MASQRLPRQEQPRVGWGATAHQPLYPPLPIVHSRLAGALLETFFMVDKNHIDYSMTISEPILA